MLRPHAPAVLLAAVLALAACGSDEPTASPSPELSSAVASPSASPSAAPSEPAASEPEPVVTPDDAQVVAVTVAGGEVSGDTGRVAVAMGTTVRLTITTDTADEVHVHGFDLTAALSPGQATQLEFVADRPGVFEVELHDSRQVLTRLQIS